VIPTVLEHVLPRLCGRSRNWLGRPKTPPRELAAVLPTDVLVYGFHIISWVAPMMIMGLPLIGMVAFCAPSYIHALVRMCTGHKSKKIARHI